MKYRSLASLLAASLLAVTSVYVLISCDGPPLLAPEMTAAEPDSGSTPPGPGGGAGDSGAMAGGNPDASGGMSTSAAASPSNGPAEDSGSDATAVPSSDAGQPDAAGTAGTADAGMTDATANEPAFELYGAPLIFAPTSTTFSINVVLLHGSPYALRAYVRAGADQPWLDPFTPVSPAMDTAEWTFHDLSPGTRYEYKIVALVDDEETQLYDGSVTTQRPEGEPFTFDLLTDTHISPREVLPVGLETYDTMEQTLIPVAMDIKKDNPDFIMNLGDTLDFHRFGFNAPPPDGSWTRFGYLNYRRLLADTLGNAPYFSVVGNWDGENGDYTPDQIAYSREQRLLYVPGPKPETYPEGGSRDEDYYAFTWGDALFVVLNVVSYTPTSHLLSSYPGEPDDWTLGEKQLEFLTQTLENATSKWRFLFIHHTVGGAAGNPANSGYGRGGGQAAYVGEQAVVHELMLEHGVQIFFYGHDHVFTDIVVDGIHYTLPGSAGAPWKFTSEETGYTDYWPDSGYGRVQVSPESVQVEFVALGGNVLYSYTLDGSQPSE